MSSTSGRNPVGQDGWDKNPCDSRAEDCTMSLNIQAENKEQAFLESFFLLVAQFEYDKAKDLAEKERELAKSPASPTWQCLLYSLSQLALAEKSYNGLAFLSSKGFLRKDSLLKSQYETLRNDFYKLETNESFASNDSLEKLLAHMCGQLNQFVVARLELMEFYEKACNIGPGKNACFEEMLTQIQQISSENQKKFHHPSLSYLKSAFIFEIEALSKFLDTQVSLQQCNFFNSLMHLYEAYIKLGAWEALIQPKDGRRGLSFAVKPHPLPPLYQWMWRLKNSLVSKFSLYFHDILSKQTTPQEMKAACAKTDIDFYSRMVSFQRKTDAKCIVLVFDANNCENYKSPGYHHPDTPFEPKQGLESYPAIVCYPPEKPAALWPNIVMIIADRAAELSILDRVLCFYDKGSQVTYFLIRTEPRITLVIIFDARKSEKDSHIMSFMTTFANDLRCSKVFASLKPGSK